MSKDLESQSRRLQSFCILSGGWLATGLLPQSEQSFASSQHDLEAPRSVPNGFHTSLHSGDGERVREWGRDGGNANTKGDELPAILQIHTHSYTGPHIWHVVMQCKSECIVIHTLWHGENRHNNTKWGKSQKQLWPGTRARTWITNTGLSFASLSLRIFCVFSLYCF